MNLEKWSELQTRVENDFTVLNKGTEPGQIPGETVEFIEWELGGRQLRAEWHDKPRLKDKKTIYSRRAGSQTVEQFEYDEEERVNFARFLERVGEDDEWREISLQDFV
jgi:hypothetical protein